MKNLIIIGNGFDMAHDLDTSYSNFMEFLINNKFKNKELYSDLFEFSNLISSRCNSFSDIVKDSNNFTRRSIFDTKNIFFKRLAFKLLNLNWCDIEYQYFIELSNIGESGRYGTAKHLNSDFETVKKYLSEYLKIEQSKFEEISSFRKYFKNIQLDSSMVLNFNYTDTVSKYIGNYSNTELVHIHGEIESENNPIIFGYAADDIESRKLLQFDDKEYLRNIKKHNYKRTQEENRLTDFLNKNQSIEVSIIGHSCGVSDKLILNQIFNNDHVEKIRVYYYSGYEHFFETQVNIDRIMNNDRNFKKLINYQDSIFIPQKNVPLGHENFNNLVLSMIEMNKKADKLRFGVF